MHHSRALFHPVRRTLLLLPCLLMLLSVLISRAAPQAVDGGVDLGFQDAAAFPIGPVYALASQPDGKILIGGSFTHIDGVKRNNIARLTADGSLDPTFDPPGGTNVPVAALAVQPNGKVIIGGNFTSVNGVHRNRIARLNADGTLDASFAASLDNGERITTLIVQADGKILLAGFFQLVNGVSRSNIARLNADGTLDVTFQPQGSTNYVIEAMALQPDGKILVSGSWYNNDVSHLEFKRLNADGSLDSTFNPAVSGDGGINDIILQPNGKLILGGNFPVPGRTNSVSIARLNADGSIDSSFATPLYIGGEVTNVTLQPDGKIIIGGVFTPFDGTNRNRIARLNADGSFDTSFVANVDEGRDVADVVLQSGGKILIAGMFGSVNGTTRTSIARLNVDGSLDPAFPATSIRLMDYNGILAITPQPDGKILIGGTFSSVSGTIHNGIARLNADGSLDPTFATTGVVGMGNIVKSIVLQADGKMIIGGNFAIIQGMSRNKVARLNANGTLDLSFNAGTALNSGVESMVLQVDGKILVSTGFNGSITRLNTDGSRDTSFAPVLNDSAQTLAIQPDGKILIGGWFTSVNGVSRNRIARLNADGSLDPAFVPSSGADNGVTTLAVQPDGKILIGGWFTSVNGVSRNRIARLNTDGSLDPAFNISTDAVIYAMALQPNNKILIGGNLQDGTVGRLNRIARLNADGSLDPAFDQSMSADGDVNAVALQPDGKILIGGVFTNINGVRRTGIARVHNTIENPRVFLSPATSTIGQGQIFQLELKFDTAGRQADTVDAYLSFDPTALEVIDATGDPAVSITPNTAVVSSVTYNRVDPVTGQIDFSASKYDSPYLTGSATAATIRFRAKVPITSTSVQLFRSGTRQSDLFRSGSRLQATLGHTTVQIADGPVLCGRIAVEQRGPAGTARWITPLFRTEGTSMRGGITLFQPGTTTEVARFAATTDVNGRFCVTAVGVPIGAYDVRVKGANTLSTQRANVNLVSPQEINFGTLLVGDGSGDDGVTGADVSYIIPSLFLGSDDAEFRPYADTNRDDAITGGDVSALIPNFLRAGPIAVTSSTTPQAATLAQTTARPQIQLSPALGQIQSDVIVPLSLQLQLGDVQADTIDLHLSFDPSLLEIVDAAGRPVQALTVNHSAFGDITYNRVDAATGQIGLSASRLRGPAATGTLPIATVNVRAKQLLTTAQISFTSTGLRQTNVFVHGQSLQPTLNGGVLTMADLYHVYIPAIQ